MIAKMTRPRGMRFALLEIKLALANIVRKFTLVPSEKTNEPLGLDPWQDVSYVKNGLYRVYNWLLGDSRRLLLQEFVVHLQCFMHFAVRKA